MAHSLPIRWSIADPGERAYYRIHALAGTGVGAMVRAAGARWAIEVALEEAKGACGLDEYAVCRGDAWHRHITLALLAHAALIVARRGGRKRGVDAGDLPPLTAPAVRRLLCGPLWRHHPPAEAILAWSR